MLHVEEVSPTADATKVAEAYIAALRRHLSVFRVLTLEEFSKVPAQSIMSRGLRNKDRQRLLERLSEARRDVTSTAHSALARCYDYLQAAKEDPEHALFELYKMIETIENEFGGEAKAIKALGVPELKELKKLANDSTATSRDQRHAPQSPTSGSSLTESEQAQVIEKGGTILRAFETRILERS